MKKVVIAIISTIGAISSLITITQVLPEYKMLFIAIIGIVIGFFLGIYVEDKNHNKDLNSKKKKEYDKIKLKILYFFLLILSPGILLSIVILVFYYTNALTESVVKSLISTFSMLFVVNTIALVTNFNIFYEKSNKSSNKK